MIRLGPMGSPDGVRINFGFGGRYLRPGFYARAGSTLSNGGTITVTPDSITANVAVEELHTVDWKEGLKQGSGLVGDFLLRLEWPTQGLAVEAAPYGVRVNAVAPGIIRTGIHEAAGEPGRLERVAPNVPMGRVGEPEEVAAAIAWLLGDECPYATGAVLRVAGGR